MKSILVLFLICAGYSCFSQVTNHDVEPKDAYKDIEIINDLRISKLLLDTNSNNLTALIDSVESNPNIYSPPVLYVLSKNLFVKKQYNNAAYWFYLAQLRARYDANRCADKTASPVQYNEYFGPDINRYASKHLDTLEAIVDKVVAFEKSNAELYDQRWINLTGIDAMSLSLGNKPSTEKLSVDKSLWPAIKKKTIDTFYSTFKEALAILRKKQ